MPLPLARTSIHLPVVGSTSDHARELVASGDPALPLVVRADRQTRGRGRGENAWWSDAGSLTFTVALDPAAHGLRAEQEPRLALATAVAVIEALAPRVPAGILGVRWPNDIEAGGRKLGGLLPERIATPHGPRLLIGVGLNVSTRLDGAPPEVRRMAMTVEQLRGGPVGAGAVDDLFHAILEAIGRVLPRLARDDPALAGRWADLDTLAGHPVRVDRESRIIVGVGRGIDAEGCLVLATEEGLLALTGGRVLRD